MNEKYLKSAVLGASDGIITTFAVVAGVVGAGFSSQIIIVLGIASMVADGVSMAVGDFLGERSVAQMRAHKSKEAATELRDLYMTSVVTFAAFIAAGVLPLIPYVVMLFGATFSTTQQFVLSIIATLGSLFFVGSLRTKVMGGNWLANGMEMLLVGSVAAVIAYGLGAFVEALTR